MKIVFWGTPKYAAENLLSIINSGYEITAVITQPDRKRGRGKKLSPSPVKQVAIDYKIPVYTTKAISKDQDTKNILFDIKADVYIVVAFGQILPREILDQPKLGCWNSHASLLPTWRGAAPIQWSIISDDSKTGVCIMAMEEGLDTGPVINLESIDITDKDNLETLSNKLSQISAKLLVQSLQNIKQTKGLNKLDRIKLLNAIDQSNLNRKTTYARLIKKEDYIIDWNQSARKISKKIKGLYPNAYTFYNGKRIKIVEINILTNTDKLLLDLHIDLNSIGKVNQGKIINISKDGIIVNTNDSPILIKYGQLEGKKITDGYTLSIQANLNINYIFGF